MCVCCAFQGCDKAKKGSSFVSFFAIPQDHRRVIWLKHSGRAKLKFGNNIRKMFFCENHFYSKDIIVRGTNKCLKKNTVPISCPTICKCTETTVDDECLKFLNLGNQLTPLQSSTTQTAENTIIDKPMCPLAERDCLQNKLSQPLKGALATSTEIQKNLPQQSAPELPRYNFNFKEQLQIASDKRKIECLEAVVAYTSQMQNIVKQTGGLDSIIQANCHLIRLLDKVVYEWFQRAQRRIEIGVITDQLFTRIAMESKQIFCIQNFNPDHEWLTKFKTNYNITDLDMRLLHIQNNSFPPSVDINEIVLDVLKKNPLTEYFSDKSPKNCTISKNEGNIEAEIQNAIITKTEDDIESVVKTEGCDGLGEDSTNMKVQVPISNDEQARLHLKPLEEYVLLKDNYRAMGLISQLMDIFSTEIKSEET